MPRIRCRYEDCVFLEAGFCTSERIELDPEMGCLTYQQAEEAGAAAEEWQEDEELEVLDEEEAEEEEELEWEDEDEDEDEDDAEDDDDDEW
jgi:hypothetical protein